MKAIRIHAYGGLDVLQLEDIARPEPAADEVLVKVYASGINPVDQVVRAGSSPALKYNLTLPMTLGWDAAGVVEAVGSDVTELQPGDAVYGVPNFPGNGSYAEYCAAKATQFALKPQHLSFLEAAAVPLAGLTAWTALFEYGRLRSGQRILIQGGAGSVGALAVQFAKAKGGYVISTASAGDLDYLRQLGADEVIDYRQQPFETMVREVDVVLEVSSVRDNAERVKAISVLKSGGIFVSANTDFAFDDAVQAALAQQGATGELAANQARGEWLAEIAQLIDTGRVKVLVGRVFPLAQVADAHHADQTDRVRGKSVLEVRKD